MDSYLTFIMVILINLIFEVYDFYVYCAWMSAGHAVNIDLSFAGFVFSTIFSYCT